MFPSDFSEFPSYIIPPVLGFLVFVCLALISLFKGRRNEAGILFAGICLSGALINIDIALVSVVRDKTKALQMDRLIYLLFVFSIPIYIRFIHTFLEISRRWLDYFAYLLSLVFVFFTQTDLFIIGFREYSFGTIAKAGPVYHVFCAAGGLAVLYCLITLSVALRRAKEGRQKNRIKYILFGMGLSTFLLFLNYLPISGFDIYPMGNFGFIPAVVLAFGVLKYDLLDMDEAIRKGIVYFFLTGSMTLLYVLLLFIVNVLFLGSRPGYSLLLPFLLALIVVFLFNPIRAGIQGFTDRHFFRGKYDYRGMLKEISVKMTLFLKYDEIRDFLLHSIRGALQVESADLVIFRRREERDAFIDRHHPLVSLLEREKRPLGKSSPVIRCLPGREKEEVLNAFKSHGAVLLVPVIFVDRLNGVLTLGEKKSGELFVHEDLELLSTIANQCAVAFENARVYEEIEKLNRDLEKKVFERTAELARALEEKERTQDQLIRSESLAAIGQLVAGVAHEINNPLASALSLVQTSLESLREPGDERFADEGMEEIIDDLEFTLRELKRVRDIVRSLLGLSRQTMTFVETINVHDVIEDALRVLHNQYKALEVAIEKDYQDDLPGIEGNFANLGQVVINIIQNAIQALPGGRGTIRLTTRFRGMDRIVFECRDNGIGISPRDSKNIFKPFFTTKEAGRGTGLGLYISHEIIKRHGGEIEVASNVNEGSVFRIQLPLRQERSPE